MDGTHPVDPPAPGPGPLRAGDPGDAGADVRTVYTLGADGLVWRHDVLCDEPDPTVWRCPWYDLDAGAVCYVLPRDAAGDGHARPQDAGADQAGLRVADQDARGFFRRRRDRRPAVVLGFDYPDAIDWEDL
jgi:hypothetical protein